MISELNCFLNKNGNDFLIKKRSIYNKSKVRAYFFKLKFKKKILHVPVIICAET